MESERFEISYPAYLKIPKTNLRIRKVTNIQTHTSSRMFMSLAANQQISLCMHTSTRCVSCSAWTLPSASAPPGRSRLHLPEDIGKHIFVRCLKEIKEGAFREDFDEKMLVYLDVPRNMSP